MRSWERAAGGLNNMLAVYGKGEKPRYPLIDTVSWMPRRGYGQVVHTAMGLMNERAEKWDAFYEPTRALALRLLDINWRDEAGRLEPMHLGENAAAFKRIADGQVGGLSLYRGVGSRRGSNEEMERTTTRSTRWASSSSRSPRAAISTRKWRSSSCPAATCTRSTRGFPKPWR